MVEEDDRSRTAKVEPIYAALEERDPPPRAGSSGLAWKLLWAGLVLLALIAVVVNQTF